MHWLSQDRFAEINRHGVPERPFQVKAGTDIFVTGDHFFCVSQRMKELIQSNEIEGLEFHAMPNSEYHLLEPTLFIEFDETIGQFNKSKGKCAECGRPYSFKGVLYPSCFVPPGNALAIFCPKGLGEDVGGAQEQLYTSATVMKIIKNAKMKGTYFGNTRDL